MNTKEKIKLVSDLVKHYQELNKTFDQLDSLFGGSCESKFFSAIWSTFDAYTDTVELAIGDAFKSVSWFIYDNDCGKRGLECKFGGKSFKIKTVNDLIKYVELTS
jgi:hypothetical protein